MRWLVWILVLATGLYVVMGVYLAAVLKWEDDKTVGLKYFGRSRPDRERFKRILALNASLLAPVLWLNNRLVRFDFSRARIQYKGVSAPAGACSVDSFQRAETYRPGAADIFVVTQLKCGTTWMQHVVFEVLHRGRGNLVESGAAMFAISPWLEGRRSVPVDEAPLVGSERPSRIINTHLPVILCPSDQASRFIYVARHPASCFASCVDFILANAGAMAPPMTAIEGWFSSKDLMWWGTWTDHVLGWWRWSQEQKNVLFIRFEDMKQDLPAVIRQVAVFLGMKPLSDEEVASISEKCSFRYMQDNQASFETMPPRLLQARATSFVSDTADQHGNVSDEVRLRVVGWAARELSGTGFPLADFYPDVATAS